jgi:hypothetical protein
MGPSACVSTRVVPIALYVVLDRVVVVGDVLGASLVVGATVRAHHHQHIGELIYQDAEEARNTEAERRCCEIRLRAERKADQILAIIEKATGTRGQLSGGRVVRPPANPPSLPERKALGVTASIPTALDCAST